MKNLDELKKENNSSPFRIPEGYFEGFNEKLMRQIPFNDPKESEKRVTFMEKLKPVLYMAAMFASIIITLKLFVKEGSYPQTDHNGYTEFAMIDSHYDILEESMADYILASMDDYSLIETYE